LQKDSLAASASTQRGGYKHCTARRVDSHPGTLYTQFVLPSRQTFARLGVAKRI
jgi:hypothetical protein